jgi:hypothetical protein
MKLHLAVVCMLCLAGCYTPNDERFSGYIRALVKPETPLEVAVEALEHDGGDVCSGSTAACRDSP